MAGGRSRRVFCRKSRCRNAAAENSKFEIRNPKEIRTFKMKGNTPDDASAVSRFPFFSPRLFRISDFGFRDSQRIWVLPNRNTIGLAAVLLGMWWAGVSQNNGAAYLLCFVLAAIAAVSTIHTWSNVNGVEITADPVRPVFAGEELKVR